VLLTQARWMDDNALTTLSHIEADTAQQLAARGLTTLPQLLHSLHPQQQRQQQQQQQRRGPHYGSSAARTFSRDQLTSMLSSVLGGSEAAEVLSTAERLPVVSVAWHAHRVAADGAANGGSGDDSRSSSRWSLEVQLQRQQAPAGGSRRPGGGSRAAVPRVVAPLFPKLKQEGWWLLVGHVPSLELLALKRLSFGGRSSVKLTLPALTASGAELHSATLFLVSDCYLGLDQQYEVVLDAAAAGRPEAAAAAAARTGWQHGAEVAGGGGDDGAAAAAQRARRQQQAASRKQRAAAEVDGSDGGAADGGGAMWEDEPSTCG
jgi:activating signal cointegrator complex subunit 3